MINKPLVSVLMTAYNREKYIAEAIESVKDSTYQNWELIIVDDGSKDRTVEIAKRYEDKDERIKVYINEKNLGQFPNRNKAANYATGKYLKFLDSDDYIYPYGLEQLVFYMEQSHDAGYGLCSLPQDDNTIYPYQLSPEKAYREHYIEDFWIFNKAPLSSIIKRDAYTFIGGCNHHKVSGDFYLWNNLSQFFNVVLMPGGIVWYREHAEGEMEKTRTDINVAFEYLLVENKLLKSSKCPLSKSDQKAAIKKAERKQARYILRHIKSHGLKTALQLQQKANLTKFEVFIKAFSKI